MHLCKFLIERSTGMLFCLTNTFTSWKKPVRQFIEKKNTLTYNWRQKDVEFLLQLYFIHRAFIYSYFMRLQCLPCQSIQTKGWCNCVLGNDFSSTPLFLCRHRLSYSEEKGKILLQWTAQIIRQPSLTWTNILIYEVHGMN